MKEKVDTKTLLKSGFWYTTATFLTRAMAFLTMPFFTRILTNDQYGGFTSFATYLSMMLIICGLEVYSTVNRARFDFSEEGELDGYISSSLLLSTLFTGGLFFLYIIFPSLFERFFLMERKYFFIMFAYLFTYPAFAMFHAKQRIEYKYKLSTTIAFSILIVAYILSFLLTITLEEDRLFGRIMGQYSIYIMAGIVFYGYFLFRSHHVTVRAWKYAIRIGLPLVFAYLGSQLLLFADVLVVKQMCSNEEVSYLSVTHSCNHIILLLVQSMNNAWAPWFFDMLKLGNTTLIRKVYRVYLWLTVLATFGVILFGPDLVMILGGENYREAVFILPVYIISGVFTVLTAQFSNLETYYKKTEYAAFITGIAGLLNVVLNILGVKLWGYRMVAYSTLICQLILVSMHYLFTTNMRIRDLLPPKELILALLSALLMIPVAFLLYQNNTIRYIFIFVLVVAVSVVFYIKRESIRILIGKLKNRTDEPNKA